MRNGRIGSNGLIDNLKADAIRYFKNGSGIIKKAPRRNGSYSDVKPIQEGAGIMYLGVLKALNAFALTRPGYSKDSLPRNVQEYRELLTNHTVHNGKLRKAFDIVYAYLHILIYYRDEKDARVIKEGIDNARFIVEKLLHTQI